jgi:hypothetical protein
MRPDTLCRYSAACFNTATMTMDFPGPGGAIPVCTSCALFVVRMGGAIDGALINVLLLDISAALIRHGLKASVSYPKGEIRCANPKSGIGQVIALAAENGAILVYWVWESPAPVPDGDQGDQDATGAELGDQHTADTPGPRRGRTPGLIRDYEEMGLMPEDSEGIAARVKALLRPVERRTPKDASR